MKNLLFFSIILVLFSGCDYFNPKPSGYNTCDIRPLLKDDNNTTYFPIFFPPTHDKIQLYTMNGTMLKKSPLSQSDIASLENIESPKSADINVNNVLYTVMRNSSDDFNYKISYTLSKIKMNDKNKNISIKEFVDSYYNFKINLDEVISDISKVTDQTTYLLPISIYPDGLYIIYPSKKHIKFNRGGNPGYIGYKVSYYRYYPANAPEQYVDVKIPCKASRY